MTSSKDGLLILQLSDSHILSKSGATLLGIDTLHYFEACLRQAIDSGQHFDLLLLTGDLAQEACLASYQRIAASLNIYSEVPCLCLPGNHDDYELMQQVFNTDKVSCKKQMLLAGWQVINLNSQILGEPGGYLDDSELVFLQQCLDDYPEHFAIIAVHHHCLKTGSSWMDTMMIENSEAMLAIVEQYSHVKVITNGHIHQAMEATVGEIHVLGSPSTCFQFEPGSDQFSVVDTAPGYRILKLGAEGSVKSEVFRLPGRLTELQDNGHGY